MNRPLPMGNGFFSIMKTSNAYIMAGGQSRRMGRDKLFLLADGVPLVQKAVDICREQFDNVYLVAKEAAKFRTLKCTVLLDAPDADGPLAGIITALHHCADPTCFVTAADMPDLDATVIRGLLNAYAGEQYLGLQEPDNYQPLCGIYGKSSLPILLAAAKRGEFALHTILAHLDSRFIELNIAQWRNVNQPIDLMPCKECGNDV